MDALECCGVCFGMLWDDYAALNACFGMLWEALEMRMPSISNFYFVYFWKSYPSKRNNINLTSNIQVHLWMLGDAAMHLYE